MTTRSLMGGAGTIRLTIEVVVFAGIAFLYWFFGHPSRADWQAVGAFFAWVLIMESFSRIEQRLDAIEQKLDGISRGS